MMSMMMMMAVDTMTLNFIDQLESTEPHLLTYKLKDKI